MNTFQRELYLKSLHRAGWGCFRCCWNLSLKNKWIISFNLLINYLLCLLSLWLFFLSSFDFLPFSLHLVQQQFFPPRWMLLHKSLYTTMLMSVFDSFACVKSHKVGYCFTNDTIFHIFLVSTATCFLHFLNCPILYKNNRHSRAVDCWESHDTIRIMIQG